MKNRGVLHHYICEYNTVKELASELSLASPWFSTDKIDLDRIKSLSLGGLSGFSFEII